MSNNTLRIEIGGKWRPITATIADERAEIEGGIVARRGFNLVGQNVTDPTFVRFMEAYREGVHALVPIKISRRLHHFRITAWKVTHQQSRNAWQVTLDEVWIPKWSQTNRATR